MAIGLMALTSILAGLLIPIVSFLMGFLGIVEPFQVQWGAHVLEISRFRARYMKQDHPHD